MRLILFGALLVFVTWQWWRVQRDERRFSNGVGTQRVVYEPFSVER